MGEWETWSCQGSLKRETWICQGSLRGETDLSVESDEKMEIWTFLGNLRRRHRSISESDGGNIGQSETGDMALSWGI